jgi:hypothetical protein
MVTRLHISTTVRKTVMRKAYTLLAIGLMPLLVSCASSPPVVTDPVGPAPLSKDEATPKGYLKVFSAAEDHNDGDVHYYPHTAYKIYDQDGKLYKRVANAIGIHDEDPSLVRLPVGTYTVEADAEWSGMVKVPVVIEPGRLTSVNLEYDWKRTKSPGNDSDWVRLPNGQIVGYRARTASAQ